MSPSAVRALIFAAALLVAPGLVSLWVADAAERLSVAQAEAAGQVDEVAIAQAAEDGYCSMELKKILRRVLTSCGLLTSGEVRGCQPLEAKQVATLAGEDFNALFSPLSQRAGIVQFDPEDTQLDVSDQKLVDELFADRRGASYFFVVARASPDGSEETNRALSEGRGKAVLDHLRTRFADPDLDREVGLLWLGEEFAQLDASFCDWRRSGLEGEPCTEKELNRSAFAAWIDCRL